MGIRGPHESGVHHVREHEIVNIASAAGNEPRILNSGDGGPEITNAHLTDPRPIPGP